MRQDRIDAIFLKRLLRWGLRGDKVLWDALHTRMIARGLPDTEEAFMAVLADDFEQIVGQGVDGGDEPVAVSTLRRKNGGMSNGMVSPAAWRMRLMPRLRARYRGEPDEV